MKKSFILALLLGGACYSVASHAQTAAELDGRAVAAFQRGDFAAAIQQWEAALAADPGHASHRLSRLAAAYQAQGLHGQAFEYLGQALELAQAQADHAHQAAILSQLSDAWLSIGDLAEASELADTAVELADGLGQPELLARALTARGNVLAVDYYSAEAVAAFREGLELARQAGDAELTFKTRLNLVSALLENQQADQARVELEHAEVSADALAPGYTRATGYLSLGVLALDLAHYAEAFDPGLDPAQLRLHAQRAWQRAADHAQALRNPRTASSAYGYQAELYEAAQRHQDALALARKAIFYAEQGDNPDLLYRWQWLQGRLFNALGQRADAIAAYRLASATLTPIQYSLGVGYRSPRDPFDTAVRPVYYELADLLLQQAATETDPARNQTLLREAQAAVEQVKVAELQDYLQDECVVALQAKATELSSIDPRTAVIYPLPLADRLVVLLSIQGQIEQVEVPVTSAQLDEAAYTLRQRLQTRPNNRFLHQSQQIYDWLIRPVIATLRAHHIDTLVIVPDGGLRLLPLSTLHDGDHFLVEEFAVVTSPGLTLTEPRKIDWSQSYMLLVGLSDAVQEYPPLPGVPKELADIGQIFSTTTAGGKTILNGEYSTVSLQQSLRQTPYSVVHMATHGEFDSDPDHTYLLTYDSKLHMDRLQEVIGVGKFRDKPIELLTLSACKTAVGDDRAALGLAGVAVKAGARSAVASLWFVDDEATSIVITEFYRQLMSGEGLSKAQALRNAQRGLIAQSRYWHPSYWAPFLLIGNWL